MGSQRRAVTHHKLPEYPHLLAFFCTKAACVNGRNRFHRYRYRELRCLYRDAYHEAFHQLRLDVVSQVPHHLQLGAP